MSKTIRYAGIITAIIITTTLLYFFTGKSSMLLADVKTPQDAIALFPKSPTEIKSRLQNSLAQAKKEIDAIIAIPDEQRTYANTAHAFDTVASLCNATINAAIFNVIDMTNPDEVMRNTAREALLAINTFFIDNVGSNKKLYQAFKAYAHGNATQENLSNEQQYFLDETLRDFERSGLGLPDDQLDTVKKVKKELTQLELEFDKNIAQDASAIEVTREELAGLSDDFVNSLPKTTDGKYSVGVAFPIYIQVAENCTNAETRKKIWQAYQNRAYPINKQILQDIIAKRYELAQLLGFKTYAALELDSQMVHTPGRAQEFIDELSKKSLKKAAIEFKQFTQELPASVSFAAGHKLYPWDTAFVRNQYKKNKLSIDENAIAEYFPMQHAVDGLLEIYQKFFNLTFKQLPVHGLWDADVQLIEVFDNHAQQKVGYLFLDLFPRANKFSHACQSTIIPVIKGGTPNLGVAIVIANFPKPMADKPSLLLLKDVNTFFHEFGHALHALLGRTAVASFSGTHVKRDFVEMPSQMLEEWLWNPEILQMVSAHYQTGQPLPTELIDKILAARRFDSGLFTSRQLFLSSLSLAYFNDGPDVNVDHILKELYNKLMVASNFDSADHLYASFGHLTGYGSGYYGYMWSKVFALDLFGAIEREGLLNPTIGHRYVGAVIGQGGSKDPNELLLDFLGREPNQEAFLSAMGLD
jgi:thimet oligopeptidase